MKKEKVKNVNSNEEKNNVNVKTKMIKKFKVFKELAEMIEGVLLVPIVIVCIIGIISLIQLVVKSKSNLCVDTFKDTVITVNYGISEDGSDFIEESLYQQKMEEPLSMEEISKFADELTGKSVHLLADENIRNISTVLVLIIFCMDYIMVILVVGNLVKIFKEVEIKETPFTENNVKYLIRINRLAIILWAFGTKFTSIGLTSVIIISAITYIFKYGCKLQQESDETL